MAQSTRPHTLRLYRDAERVAAHKQQLAAELASAELAGMFSPSLTAKAKLLLRPGPVGERLHKGTALRDAHIEQLRAAEEARQRELCSPGKEFARGGAAGDASGGAAARSVEDLFRMGRVYQEKKEKLRLEAEAEARELAIPRINRCAHGRPPPHRYAAPTPVLTPSHPASPPHPL